MSLPTFFTYDGHGLPVTLNATPPGGAATQDNSLPVINALFGPLVVSPGTSAAFSSQQNLCAYTTMQIEIDSIGAGDAITFTRSLTGAAGLAVSAYDDSGGVYNAGITAAGLYYVKARGFITIAKTGIGSTPTVTILAHQGA